MSKKDKFREDDWFEEEGGVEEVIDDNDDFFSDTAAKRAKKRLSGVRVFFTVVLVLITCGVLAVISIGFYRVTFKYPSQEVVDITMTGRYCLDNWVRDCVQTIESTGSESFIHREIEYANGDEDKIAFYKKMLSTIGYAPNKAVAKNVYGNDMIDPETDEVVYIDSYIGVDEAVSFSYVDYDALDFEMYRDGIKKLMTSEGLSFGNVNYENRLVDVFVRFMNELPVEELPTKSVQRIPYLSYVSEGYYIDEEEDAYIDRLLFSSNEFFDCLDRFSKVAGEETGGTLVELEGYADWANLSADEKGSTERPARYGYKECCAKDWCGVYYLTNGYKGDGDEVLSAEIGDGTFGNPAGFNTDMVTNVYVDKEWDSNGNAVVWDVYPIRVSLKEYGVSQEALDWLEKKDPRNTGLGIETSVQYCYMVFEVTNLSDAELVISENMGLCDRNGNVSPRTGRMYGLQSSVRLDPDEVGYIETWQSSIELYKKYVIWGNDFGRREDPVWFRLLAGDLENDDPYKGVYVRQ